jgi:hypothetical protein
MSYADPDRPEPHGWQEALERQAFADCEGTLSEALGRARAGEMTWEEISSYARRADRAASACRSLADAFNAELARLHADHKIPEGSDLRF